jgi:antitoxin MazE
MQTRIQRWGNSLALRIPKAIAQEVRLEEASVVELSLQDGKLIVVPVVKPRWTLEELLSKVSDENRHDELSTGPMEGKEAW